ncbi:MAG: DEAD/DEAH box helicase [Acidobacteria bacterium]|nr:DEAD/DEAH box helicase [Acidobacteriota bacterium]
MPTALRCGDVVRIRSERWRIVGHVGYGGAALVEAAGCDGSNRNVRARFLLPYEPVDRLPSSPAPRLVRPTRWRYIARQTLAEACPGWSSLRTAARASLDVLPFQLEPALALTRGDGCRFLLADAVGLGKTIQAGLMIAETLARRPDARALVVAPAGLRDQWREELRGRFGVDAAILDSAGIARLAAQLPADVNPWGVPRAVITSIDYVKRPEVLRALETLTWDVLVFDEAHNLTGRSDRAAAAAMLADRARALALLTATPHSGDDAAFARLCGLGNPDGAERLILFRRTRGELGMAGSRRAPLIRVRPTADERAMHEALMAYARLVWTEAAGGAKLVASVLARRACSSAGSLARSVERRLALLTGAGVPDHTQPALPYADSGADDDQPEALLALPGLHDVGDERRRLETLLRLARAAAQQESKIAALHRLLSRVDEPAIVFTEYRDTLRQLAAAIGHDLVAELHGGLTPRERSDALHRFAAGKARILLATDTGSEGLNLHQRCRLVINLELPWTPLRLEQRAGRVDRIGQARRVHVVHLVAAGTCEEATLARLVRRLHRSHGTLSLLAAMPDERQVAEAALTHRPVPEPMQQPPAVPPGVVAMDLRREAQQEALWIRQARALAVDSERLERPIRPVIARVRSRGRRTATPRGVWLFRLAFVNRSDDLVWESLLPLTADMPGVRGRPERARAALNACHPAVQRALLHVQDGCLEALQSTLRPALRRWQNRERAVMDALRGRHARLSAALAQRGLFDRRHERLAEAQAVLLDRALSDAEDRLADLCACEQLRADACELIWAVALE